MRQRKPDRIKYLFGLISIFMLLVLSGCAGSGYWTWQHPDKQGELQLLKDQKECRDLAQAEVANINYYFDFYDMYASPYYWPSYRDRHHRIYGPYFSSYSHYRFMQQQDDLDRFFRICMKSKGWRRVKIEPDKKQPVE
jgi:hypothetical protein